MGDSHRDGSILAITPTQALQPAEQLSPVDELTEAANQLLSKPVWIQPELFRGPRALTWLTQGEAVVHEVAERFRAAGWKVTVLATADQADQRFHRLAFELPEPALHGVGQA